MAVATKKWSLPAIICTRAIDEEWRYELYLKTSRNPVFGDWLYDPWQIKDMKFVRTPKHDEIMLLRNRGGSKTRDGTVLAVWFGYQKRPIKTHNIIHHWDWMRVIWYAASEPQLKQALKYFRENRYVKEATKEEVTLWNGQIIELRIVSKKQAASPRADVIFFDEEQDMNKEFYQLVLGTQVGGGGKRIHMGTTEMDTILENNFKRLNPRKMVLEHHVDELSWTTEETELKKYEGQPDFVIRSQLYCEWIRPGGRVFEHFEVRELTKEEKEKLSFDVFYGIDPNPKNGHAVVKVRYIGYDIDEPEAIYVEEEFGSEDLLAWYNYFDDKDDSELLAMEMQGRLKWNVNCEVEGNAVGEEFLKTFYRVTRQNYDGTINTVYWNEKSKHARIIGVRKVPIIINPECERTREHVSSAVWNPKKSKAELLKTPEQHFLDAFLHSCALSDMVRMSVA